MSFHVLPQDLQQIKKILSLKNKIKGRGNRGRDRVKWRAFVIAVMNDYLCRSVFCIRTSTIVNSATEESKIQGCSDTEEFIYSFIHSKKR
jgi:hypothetical protein